MFIAGPCAVESEKELFQIGEKLKELGIEYLRGGAFKPRTSANSFQGLGFKALDYLKEVKESLGLKIVTEVVAEKYLDKVVDVADFIQIGARNMYNYELLKTIAKEYDFANVLLKRGFSATKKEIFGSISYLKDLKGEIVFVERGIRTFTDYNRFTLDVGLIADLKHDINFKYKVLVDPSHAAGRSDIVAELTYAGIAAGADGYIIEVKTNERKVPIVDADQAITLKQLEHIHNNVKNIFDVFGR